MAAAGTDEPLGGSVVDLEQIELVRAAAQEADERAEAVRRAADEALRAAQRLRQRAARPR